MEIDRQRRLTVGQATVATVAAQLAGALATVAATPYLVRQLGVAPYGILLATIVLAGQLTPVQLGMPAAAIRLLAASRGRGDPRGQAAILRSLAGISVAVTALAGVVFFVLAPWVWRHSFGESEELLRQARAALPAAAALVMAQPLVAVSQAALMGQERFGFVSGIRAVHGIARIALTVAAVALGGGVAAALWAQAAADIVAAAVGAVQARGRHLAAAGGEEVAAATRSLATLGVPFAAVDGLAALLLDGEKLVLGMMRSAADITYYIVPFHAAFRLTVLTTALSGVLIPRISSAAAAGDRRSAGVLIHRANRLTAVAMTSVLALLAALAPELLTLWMGAEFAAQAAPAARVILVALFATTSANAAHAAMRAVGRPSLLTALYAAELVIHAGVVFLAIRHWGIVGAALAWGIRATVDAVAQRILAARVLGATIGPWREYWIPQLALAALAGGSQALGPGAPWPARAAAAVLLTLGMAHWLLDRHDRRLIAGSLLPWRTRAPQNLEP